MNRLFTFLIISILFSQSAWAFHDIELSHVQDQEYSQVSNQNDVAADYDHCGHATAHLVGLLSEKSLDIYLAPISNDITVKNITSSMSYQPPVPPPTV